MELINDIYTYLHDAISLLVSYIVSPNKRIYYLYLLSSAVLATLVYYSKPRKTSIIEYFFGKKHWWGQSAFTDYGLMTLNSLVKVILIAPFLIFSLKIAFYTHEYIIDTWGYFKGDIPKSFIIGLYTITIFVLGDFTSWLLHYLQHKIPFLWRFHAIHHSATVLNPLTQYRIHPVELLFNNARSIIVIGVLMGVFEYLGNGRVSYFTFNSVNVLNFIFLFFGANLRHSSVELKYPSWLEVVFISPYQHQIHHSNAEEHFDKNMGAKLAIWDWMFGTLILSKSVDKIKFGLGVAEDAHYNSLWKNIIRPFKSN
ncbi:MAG: sterol desaturase family protein [Saprospiraceae bacterium]